jgi:hypothetical protein
LAASRRCSAVSSAVRWISADAREAPTAAVFAGALCYSQPANRSITRSVAFG